MGALRILAGGCVPAAVSLLLATAAPGAARAAFELRDAAPMALGAVSPDGASLPAADSSSAGGSGLSWRAGGSRASLFKASWISSWGSPPWRSASAICPSRVRARGSLRRGSHWRKARGGPSRLGSRWSAWIHPPRIPRVGEGGPWGHAPEGASIRESRRGSGPSASSARDRSTALVSPPPSNSAARSRRAGARSASSSAGNPTRRTAPASCSISRWAAPRA